MSHDREMGKSSKRLRHLKTGRKEYGAQSEEYRIAMTTTSCLYDAAKAAEEEARIAAAAAKSRETAAGKAAADKAAADKAAAEAKSRVRVRTHHI